jgi:hypothetical protein
MSNKEILVTVISAVLVLGAFAPTAQASDSGEDPLEETPGVAYCSDGGGNETYYCYGYADGCVGKWASDSNDPDAKDKDWHTSVCASEEGAQFTWSDEGLEVQP